MLDVWDLPKQDQEQKGETMTRRQRELMKKIKEFIITTLICAGSLLLITWIMYLCGRIFL